MVCSKGYTREFCDWGANRSKVVISENLTVFKFGDFVSGHIKYWRNLNLAVPTTL